MSSSRGCLVAAAAKAYPDHAPRHRVSAELIGEIGDITQIELRPDKQVFGEVNINSYSRVKLKMTGAAERYSGGLTDCGSYAQTLVEGKTRSRAADAAHQF